MNKTAPRALVLRSIILALLHFVMVWLVGLWLFLRDGFFHSQVPSIYETALCAGIVVLGFPDTGIGWLANSVFYGVGAAGILHLGSGNADGESLNANG